jgi:hypothetical protein
MCPNGYVLQGEANETSFKKGNQAARRENMDNDSHNRRVQGIFKAWAARSRKVRGERVMSRETKEKIIRRHTIRIRENIVKEAREMQALMKSYTEEAAKRVYGIIESEHAKDSDVIAAAQFLFDRAYGKATQTNLNANVDANGRPKEVTGKELDARISAALDRVERITGGAPEKGESEERSDNLRIDSGHSGGGSVH